MKSKRRQLNHRFSVKMGETQIEPSATVKVLGVTIDSNLTFDAQISSVIRRCYATMSGLAKLAHSLPKEVKQIIIEALVFPHLSYCMTVWAGCSKVQKHRLQKVINHCAQIVHGTKRTAHVSPMMRELKWPKVDELVAENDLKIMHWLLFHDQAPASLRQRVTYRGNVSERETRATDAGQLQIPRVRTEHARKFFDSRAIAQWNNAPGFVRGASTSAKCRREARKWLLANNK